MVLIGFSSAEHLTGKAQIFLKWRGSLQQKPSILIIEQNRRELSRDFQVLACEDSSQALALASTPNLAAVVLEPVLSNNLGWKLFDELREALKGRAVPIVLCSTMDERKRGQEAGAADFLVKPVLPSILLETLHRVIQLSSKV